MKEIDYLIIGQGISGTCLSAHIHNGDKTFHVVDNYDSSSASRISSGVINPVTGKRMVRTWMIDQLLPFAQSFYTDLSKSMGTNFISHTKINQLIRSKEEENTWDEKSIPADSYLGDLNDPIDYKNHFESVSAIGTIQPALVIDVKSLLDGWRNFLIEKDLISNKRILIDDLDIQTNGIVFNGIRYKNMLLADGASSLSRGLFPDLIYKDAKGEALEVSLDGATFYEIIKCGITLIPKGGNRYWLGSNYEWDATDHLLSEKGKNEILQKWANISSIQLKLLKHQTAFRACSKDRKPYIGQHSVYKNIYLLNGMGTKGISLAPYFSKSLLNHIESGQDLIEEVDLRRT